MFGGLGEMFFFIPFSLVFGPSWEGWVINNGVNICMEVEGMSLGWVNKKQYIQGEGLE